MITAQVQSAWRGRIGSSVQNCLSTPGSIPSVSFSPCFLFSVSSVFFHTARTCSNHSSRVLNCSGCITSDTQHVSFTFRFTFRLISSSSSSYPSVPPLTRTFPSVSTHWQGSFRLYATSITPVFSGSEPFSLKRWPSGYTTHPVLGLRVNSIHHCYRTDHLRAKNSVNQLRLMPRLRWKNHTKLKR